MTTIRWTTRALAAALGTVAAFGAGATAHAAPTTDVEQRNVQLIQEAFARGVGADDTFYAILADDVQWTVARADTPSTYTGRQDFLDNGAAPIVDRLNGEIRAQVQELVADDNQVAARWHGTATARDGQPYVNEYAWFMTMENERVTRVVAYLDLVALNDLIERVPV
ncbi:MAG: nuclear transport factor 2 family protein [Mycobacterium sp.]